MREAALQFFLSEEAVGAGIKFSGLRTGDAGFDLPSLCDQIVPPHGFVLLRTGVHIAIPLGWVGLVRDRSSVAMRGGATTAGVIDASYRGEVKVAMHNFGAEPIVFKCGDRLAQLVVIEHLPGTLCTAASSLEELGTTDRGAGGFGSTGK